MSDALNLQRFVDAQEDIYPRVLAELRAGEKRSHWMWFIFPQRSGLGSSAMAVRYAINSMDEARAYLAHPVLGACLRECTELVLETEGRSVHEIFGSPDDMKFHSSMSLFAEADGNPSSPFQQALDKFFAGKPAVR